MSTDTLKTGRKKCYIKNNENLYGFQGLLIAFYLWNPLLYKKY